jgi:transposase
MSSQKKPQHYTSEFKESAVTLAIESDQAVSKPAEELGINKNTLHTWISKYK